MKVFCKKCKHFWYGGGFDVPTKPFNCDKAKIVQYSDFLGTHSQVMTPEEMNKNNDCELYERKEIKEVNKPYRPAWEYIFTGLVVVFIFVVAVNILK